jgi:hypothetical protein
VKLASFIAAAGTVLFANALALWHAAENRNAVPDSDVTLTQQEVRYWDYRAKEEDSGVTLTLQWTDSNAFFGDPIDRPEPWLSQAELQNLGFDCSVDPSSYAAARHYERQRPRHAFVALENGGPAWQAWSDRFNRWRAELRARTKSSTGTGDDALQHSRLIPIDADLDPIKLRTRHANRAGVIIVPAVIAVLLETPLKSGLGSRPARVVGRIQETPSSIHVPLPFSLEFRRRSGDQHPDYRVHLRYGGSYEPWVTAVEFSH